MGVREGASLALRDDLSDGWRAVGLVAALQSALACALSAYDTADPQDILDPAVRDDRAARLAPVSLLLRRACSQDYLSDPERLSLSRPGRRCLDALIARRNRQLHPVASNGSQFNDTSPEAERAAAWQVLRHLIVEHPAFDTGLFPALYSDLSTQLRRLD